MLTPIQKTIQKLLKLTIQFGFFFLFTLMIWGLGEGPHKDDMLLKYPVFASQLLYGNMCYDVLKGLRTIPADARFWTIAMRISGEAVALLVIAIGLLVLAMSVPFFILVGPIVALIAYLLIFTRTLPKLQPAYIQALSSESESSNPAAHRTLRDKAAQRR